MYTHQFFYQYGKPEQHFDNIPASAAYVDKFEDEVGPVPGCTNFMYNCDELNLYGSTLSCDNCLLHYYKERVK